MFHTAGSAPCSSSTLAPRPSRLLAPVRRRRPPPRSPSPVTGSRGTAGMRPFRRCAVGREKGEEEEVVFRMWLKNQLCEGPPPLVLRPPSHPLTASLHYQATRHQGYFPPLLLPPPTKVIFSLPPLPHEALPAAPPKHLVLTAPPPPSLLPPPFSLRPPSSTTSTNRRRMSVWR